MTLPRVMSRSYHDKKLNDKRGASIHARHFTRTFFVYLSTPRHWQQSVVFFRSLHKNERSAI